MTLIANQNTLQAYLIAKLLTCLQAATFSKDLQYLFALELS